MEFKIGIELERVVRGNLTWLWPFGCLTIARLPKIPSQNRQISSTNRRKSAQNFGRKIAPVRDGGRLQVPLQELHPDTHAQKN